MSIFNKRLKFTAAIFCILLSFAATQAQTKAFNFQGRLNDGANPANGRYDLQFILYDALVGGNQIGPIVEKLNTMLINGVFSTQLDFGTSAFTGSDRFIEIRLQRTATEIPNAYVILGARQQILSVPYTIKSLNSTNAVNAQNAANATNATTAQTAVNAQQLGGVPANQFVQQGGLGTVKAMLYVNPSGYILRCYNSTLSGSPPLDCGFTVTEFTQGGFGINFGFNTANTFVSVSTSNETGASGDVSPTYSSSSYPSQFPQSINVFTWKSNGSASDNAYFTIIVY